MGDENEQEESDGAVDNCEAMAPRFRSRQDDDGDADENGDVAGTRTAPVATRVGVGVAGMTRGPPLCSNTASESTSIASDPSAPCFLCIPSS